ncbi:DUF3047 domain-containing protein [Ramlibacter sp.]|uniref:DUF3047 domain-containing protein n=1 Tax=Ramlibacter sp. TaxID=1917967 RepID=UPI001847E0ED|nr:DUF3047 domain-containing protein [Ramlibacter sp.]MBA2675949.1 DUF3047 domain-containing protein [Ramlibacter sp.]
MISSAPLGDIVAPGWIHQRLPKVKRANDYAIEAEDNRRVLHVRSASSASSWITRLDVDPDRTPWLQWQWKVSRSLAGSDLRVKQGDDYAARLYVFFGLPLDRLSFKDRLGIRTARALAGVEIPAAAFCYVWGHAQAAGAAGWNPYTNRVRMVVLDSKDGDAGTWRPHARDVRRDWVEAFEGPVPHISGVGIGADTDNTSDKVDAWPGDLRFAATS